MFTPWTPGRVHVQGQRAHSCSFERRSLLFAPVVRLERGTLFTDHDSTAQFVRVQALRHAVVPRLRGVRGFTLLELLIVVGTIGLLLVLIAPAFTTIKGGTNVTSAAYTIKGILDTA